MTKKKKNLARVEEGSGNVFADLGFARPEQEQLKADLTLQIYRTIKQRGFTQAIWPEDAAALLRKTGQSDTE